MQLFLVLAEPGLVHKPVFRRMIRHVVEEKREPTTLIYLLA